MVVISIPAMLIAGITQERMGAPLTSTVHEPQTPIPQLYFVPVKFSLSRSAHNSGMSEGTSIDTDCPLIFKLTLLIANPNMTERR